MCSYGKLQKAHEWIPVICKIFGLVKFNAIWVTFSSVNEPSLNLFDLSLVCQMRNNQLEHTQGHSY